MYLYTYICTLRNYRQFLNAEFRSKYANPKTKINIGEKLNMKCEKLPLTHRGEN